MTGTNRLRATQVLTLPEQIAAQVRESILDGSLGPGDRLPSEGAMAEMYGCSRPTVREAMRTLRADHILTSARGRGGGYRVAELSLQALGASVSEVISLSLGMKTLDYAQLFAVRFDLELRSAATAATERTDADLEALRATLPADPADLPVEAALSADVASTGRSPRRPTTRSWSASPAPPRPPSAASPRRCRRSTRPASSTAPGGGRSRRRPGPRRVPRGDAPPPRLLQPLLRPRIAQRCQVLTGLNSRELD